MTLEPYDAEQDVAQKACSFQELEANQGCREAINIFLWARAQPEKNAAAPRQPYISKLLS